MFIAGLVDFRQMFEQCSIQNQSVVKSLTVFFQIVAAHTAIFADLVIAGVRQNEVWDKIIPFLTVSAAHLFK